MGLGEKIVSPINYQVAWFLFMTSGLANHDFLCANKIEQWRMDWERDWKPIQFARAMLATDAGHEWILIWFLAEDGGSASKFF